MSATFNDLSLTIDNTSLVKINRISKHNIFVNMQSRNPANSVKCRRGANMIWQAEQDGLLKAGMETVAPARYCTRLYRGSARLALRANPATRAARFPDKSNCTLACPRLAGSNL
jgi:hypothetical protein